MASYRLRIALQRKRHFPPTPNTGPQVAQSGLELATHWGLALNRFLCLYHSSAWMTGEPVAVYASVGPGPTLTEARVPRMSETREWHRKGLFYLQGRLAP